MGLFGSPSRQTRGSPAATQVDDVYSLAYSGSAYMEKPCRFGGPAHGTCEYVKQYTCHVFACLSMLNPSHRRPSGSRQRAKSRSWDASLLFGGLDNFPIFDFPTFGACFSAAEDQFSYTRGREQGVARDALDSLHYEFQFWVKTAVWTRRWIRPTPTDNW